MKQSIQSTAFSGPHQVCFIFQPRSWLRKDKNKREIRRQIWLHGGTSFTSVGFVCCFNLSGCVNKDKHSILLFMLLFNNSIIHTWKRAKGNIVKNKTWTNPNTKLINVQLPDGLSKSTWVDFWYELMNHLIWLSHCLMAAPFSSSSHGAHISLSNYLSKCNVADNQGSKV